MTAAVRTWRKTKTEKDTHCVKAVVHTESNLKKALSVNIKPGRLTICSPCGEMTSHIFKKAVVKVEKQSEHVLATWMEV